jgi:hypothetical protein
VGVELGIPTVGVIYGRVGLGVVDGISVKVGGTEVADGVTGYGV